MLNYYHRRLPNLVHILEPLHNFLRKSSKWTWRRKQKQSFEKIKEILCSQKFSVYYDPEKPLALVCDPSSYALGAALSHILPYDSEKPIAYSCRILLTFEKNYSNKERA